MRIEGARMLAISQVRPLVRAANLAQRVLERAIEEDHVTHLTHDSHVLGTLDDTTPAAHEHATPFAQALESACLGVAKRLLALGGKDARHSCVQLALHHVVDVNKPPVEHVAEVSGHRGFASTKEPDEEDVVATTMGGLVASRTPAHARLRTRFSGLMLGLALVPVPVGALPPTLVLAPAAALALAPPAAFFLASALIPAVPTYPSAFVLALTIALALRFTRLRFRRLRRMCARARLGRGLRAERAGSSCGLRATLAPRTPPGTTVPCHRASPPQTRKHTREILATRSR